jgi:predicted metal-binding protein
MAWPDLWRRMTVRAQAMGTRGRSEARLMRPILHVCTTCRTGLPLAEGQIPPGRHMHDAVARHPAVGAVELREVACLSLCDHGCAAAISMPGKWSYLLGRLDTGLVGDLLDYAGLYARSSTGAVMPSKRAPSLARMVLGRLPA